MHKIIAIAVFVFSMAVYIATVAPTTSFWDCGEFIAASYTMGVPHPPGAPLYLMIGRLFSLLPFSEDIGYRVNLVSSLVSALTVMLLYLCIVRLARVWRGREETMSDKIAVYGSAVIGALCFAFSHSFWFNAVEAEVYSMSMFFTAVVFYLALRWIDYAGEPYGNRILLLIFYIIGLSSGIHLLNILALISIALIVAFQRYGGGLKVFVVAGIVGSGIILAIYPGIIQGFPLIIQKFTIWTLLAVIGLMVWWTAIAMKKDHRKTAFALFATLLVILGYSTFLIIKIRSGLDPFLDENDPETWDRLLSYLNREQYGTESLFLTMFDRKAPFWEYQINKMYLRYLGWQYVQPSLFLGIPFILGIVGAFQQFYRDAKGGLVVLMLFVMTGLAVLMYLNQDDPQPRERDYAYVGSFFAFAIWIGLGALTIIEAVTKRIKQTDPMIAVASLSALLLLIAPMNMLAKNFRSHSRAGNYIAWDYSYNLLMTCAPDAILYTNGDNDTFPLWYLQTVANIRPDIRVANLSLLNTGWFIKQIRDKYPIVPMTSRITDDYVDNVIDSRDISGLMDRRWPQSRKVRIEPPTPDAAPLVWDVPATLSYPVQGGKNESFLRVQDLMILNTMVANKWERPVYFAVTVSDGNLLGLRDVRDESKNFLAMEGLAFRLHHKSVPIIDDVKMAENLLKVYKYRNISNPNIYYDDNVLRLLGNYRQGLLQLAFKNLSDAQSQSFGGDLQPLSESELAMNLDDRLKSYDTLNPRMKALTALDFMNNILPEDVIPITYDIIKLQIGRLYAQLGRPDELRKRLDKGREGAALDASTAYEYGVYYLTDARSSSDAKAMFDVALTGNPSFENYQRVALTWIQYAEDTASAASVFREYLTRDDSRQAKLRVAGQALSLDMPGLAFSIFDALLAVDPNDGEAVRGMVNYYIAVQDQPHALALADDWLKRHPDDVAMRSQRGDLAKSPKLRAR